MTTLDDFIHTLPSSPCVVIDISHIRSNYQQLSQTIPADIYYAVKANPHPAVLEELARCGSFFDAASVEEIKAVLSCGVPAERISYGNTIKKEADIATAYRYGVRLFAADSKAELEKIARVARDSLVFIRLAWLGENADWPLSGKFGCDSEMATELIIYAQELGLVPYGVSFHPGSQQTDVRQWTLALQAVSEIFAAVARHGIDLQMVNMGGGFPARYQTDVPSLDIYREAIMAAINDYFPQMPRLIIEPGRSMVAEAGIVISEVVLISTKSNSDLTRWVYLDIGKFSGLAETFGEAIKYRLDVMDAKGAIKTGDCSGVILAGPTCDSLDILYQDFKPLLPDDLQIGDRIIFRNAGAYTTSYASVAFNGFPPPAVHIIEA